MVKVKRIVANIATQDTAAAQHFYKDVLGLDVLMDQGWIVTSGSAETMTVQISFMTEGGSGTRLICRSRSTTSTRRLRPCARPASPSNTARPTSPGACGASLCATRSAGW